MQSELHRAGAREAAALQLRAGAWFASQGDFDRAVQHLIAGGDLDAAGDLIWASTAAYVSTGREGRIRGWLGEFSEAQIAASPPLCLAHATVHLSDGNGAQVERWTGAARDRLRATSRPDAQTLELGARLVRSAGSAVDGVARMERDVADIHDLLPEGSPWRSLCRLVEGVSYQLTGQRDRARRALEEGSRRGAASAPHIQTLCLAQLAILALDEEDLDYARVHAEQALSLVELFGLGEYPTTSVVFAAASLVRARDVGLRRCTRLRSPASARDLNEISPWYERSS